LRLPVRTPTLPPATHTNAYILGEDRLVVVDPASPYPEEQAALDEALSTLASEGRRVERIFLTHHHVDHVSGAAHLAERLSVPVVAHPETARRLVGRVTVTETLDEGDRLDVAPGGMRVLHTPGHAPGHLCLLHEATGVLVAGDMVAQIGTIVVEPGDGGDMAEYCAQLARLKALRPSWLLPAHGDALGDPQAVLGFYLKHRLEREARVLAALGPTPATLAALVVPAYPDVPPQVHPLAQRSLEAHLIKLMREGRAERTPSGWMRSKNVS
jgi:glyoxylase-like metal-dependent hydrolase (beta-lactamase superfamily II)